jgi:hypothetical protein
MDGSSSRDGNGKNGKRAADQSFTNKVKEPRRGMGIAKLEKMRAEEEMKEKYFKNPFSQAHISGAGIQGMVSIPIFFLPKKYLCYPPCSRMVVFLYYHFSDRLLCLLTCLRLGLYHQRIFFTCAVVL